MEKTFQEDFLYYYKRLSAHPSLRAEQKRAAFDRIYQQSRERICSFSSLVDAMSRLAVFLQDGHTGIEIPYSNGDSCIPLKCVWEKDRLFVDEGRSGLEKGDEILSIEGILMENVEKYMSQHIPHENRYLVRSRMIQYPYKNYHVFSRMNMTGLSEAKSAYEFVVLREGHRVKKICPLEPYNGFLDFMERKPLVRIEPPIAIMKLDECRCDNAYREALIQLGNECQRGTITTLILDLSDNMGGSAEVIDEFIRHVNIHTYHRYEMVDYSGNIPLSVVQRKAVVENRRIPPYLPRNIFCKVSYTTFSSARTFAVTLRDNGIARIIGTPTGGRPSSYGMPEKDWTPHHRIRFRVSRCAFLRPDESRDGDESLFPDQEGNVLAVPLGTVEGQMS